MFLRQTSHRSPVPPPYRRGISAPPPAPIDVRVGDVRVADALEHERPDCLTADEQRILTLLGLLGGAALGTSQIAEVAGVVDADAQLQALERRGWVTRSGPGYRLVRSSSGVAAQFLAAKLTTALLDHMISYASDSATDAGIAAETEAIEATLRLAALDGRWREVLELALASEAKLARSGSWVSCRRVLYSGLKAARSLGDARAEAHVLHQLGSVAICLGEAEEAAWRMQEALTMRRRIGDTEGAELTRHNIGQLGEGGPFWGGGEAQPPRARGGVIPTTGGGAVGNGSLVGGRGGSGTRRPHPVITLALLVLVLACVGGVAALGHGHSHRILSTDAVHHAVSAPRSGAGAGTTLTVK